MKKLFVTIILLALVLSACVPAIPALPTLPEASSTDPIQFPGATAPTADPYVNVSKEEFYAHYTPATSHADALYRSEHGLLSGLLEVPGPEATAAAAQPVQGGQYLRNTDAFYAENGNAYIVVDCYGQEILRVYRGGAYITLEEVAAYMYAFGGQDGSFPANYTTGKKTSPQSSIWGEYLRLNHARFTGDTRRYPYEPELPDITGCGGDLQYFEMDIGTTGTVTPGYSTRVYNDGSQITRGAARLVYARQDLNRNGLYEPDEVYVFYTCNHYNDFQEYLNYYGGWGEIFGNITGGGQPSDKNNCNPTAYVITGYASFTELFRNAA